jgi:hypothetical protein
VRRSQVLAETARHSWSRLRLRDQPQQRGQPDAADQVAEQGPREPHRPLATALVAPRGPAGRPSDPCPATTTGPVGPPCMRRSATRSRSTSTQAAPGWVERACSPTTRTTPSRSGAGATSPPCTPTCGTSCSPWTAAPPTPFCTTSSPIWNGRTPHPPSSPSPSAATTCSAPTPTRLAPGGSSRSWDGASARLSVGSGP